MNTPEHHQPWLSPFRLSLIIAVIVALAGWQVLIIPEAAFQASPAGPDFVPKAVTILLAILTVAYALSALRGGQVDIARIEEVPLPGGGRRLSALFAGAILFMVLVKGLGFWIPATICALGVAIAFDASWRHIKTWVITSASTLLFWLLFAKVLKVNLGPLVTWAY